MKKSKIRKKHSLSAFLFGDSIIPGYIPFYYRLYLLFHMSWRRLYRSSKRRVLSYFFKQETILDEKTEEADKILNLGERKTPLINKTSSHIDGDLKTEELRNIAQKINELKGILEEKGLRFTTPAASFKLKDNNSENERSKLWENSWMLAHSKVNTQDVVLDIAGASTIFSFFLAHMGCNVYVIDNDWENHGIMYNARFVSNKMGWGMKVYRRNIAKRFPFKENFFDKIFCVCVLEHLPSSVRRNVMQEINRVLKP